ncbi:hypothetical protein AcV7_004726 [Taiwanofungus camphoratus]|nr:hypothetical protein AcV7_004726 [Antrodia cinnamomea]
MALLLLDRGARCTAPIIDDVPPLPFLLGASEFEWSIDPCPPIEGLPCAQQDAPPPRSKPAVCSPSLAIAFNGAPKGAPQLPAPSTGRVVLWRSGDMWASFREEATSPEAPSEFKEPFHWWWWRSLSLLPILTLTPGDGDLQEDTSRDRARRTAMCTRRLPPCIESVARCAIHRAPSLRNGSNSPLRRWRSGKRAPSMARAGRADARCASRRPELVKLHYASCAVRAASGFRSAAFRGVNFTSDRLANVQKVYRGPSLLLS